MVEELGRPIELLMGEFGKYKLFITIAIAIVAIGISFLSAKVKKDKPRETI